jgi:hypothetical protein
MKNKELRSLTVLTLGVCFVLLTVWGIASTAQQDSRTMQQPPALDHIPIVDFENPASADAKLDPKTRALRTARGERYAKHVKGFILDREIDGGMVLAFRYMQPLPAFPLGRSAIVAVGAVVDSQAYLSDDKTGIYSEFSIRIEEVLKNDRLGPTFPGSLVVAERVGGRVRFPSGRIILYGNREEGMPRQGRRYVFFLERQDQQYSLLTAYELLSDRVYPLDGRNAPGGKGALSIGDEYENSDATRFLSELQRAIAKYSQTPLKETVKP